MPKNGKTVLNNLITEMADAFNIYPNNKLQNYDDESVTATCSWFLEYGKAKIVFQYIASEKQVNVVTLRDGSFNGSRNLFRFKQEYAALQIHLNAIRTIIEDGVYGGCNIYDVEQGIIKYCLTYSIDSIT